jgi:hypothetical protein
MPEDPREPAHVEVESDSVRHVRPGLGWLLFGAAVASFLSSYLLVTLHNVARVYSWGPLRQVAALSDYGFSLAPILAVLSLLVSLVSFPPAARATLLASEDGLRIKKSRGRSKLIPRDRLVSGFVVPAGGRLELFLKRGEKLVAAIPNEHDANMLLAALGLDAARRHVAVRLGTVQGQLAFGCLMIPLTFLGVVLLLGELDVPKAIFPSIVAVSFALMMLLLLRSARPLDVIVGTDGVVLQRAWTRRFIPYAALDSVALNTSSHVVLKMQSGREVTIRKGDEAARRALCARIREAMRAQGDGSTEGRAELDLLEPRGKPLPAWREALRGLVARPGDYRRAGISEDILLSVVEDPDAAPERRIGAALALRASGREEAGPRIRVAAEACASERVREALERAAEDELDEATLERALKDAEAARRA